MLQGTIFTPVTLILQPTRRFKLDHQLYQYPAPAATQATLHRHKKIIGTVIPLWNMRLTAIKSPDPSSPRFVYTNITYLPEPRVVARDGGSTAG